MHDDKKLSEDLQILSARLQDGTLPDGCRSLVRQAVEASHATPSDVASTAHSELPSFIALPLSAFEQERHPVQRLHRWCDLVELVVRFVTVLGIAELRRHADGQPLPGELLGELRTLDRPTFGQWVALLRGLLPHLPPQSEAALPELARLADDSVLPLLPRSEEAATSVVALRNQLVHSASSTTAWAQRQLELWQERIDSFVGSLRGLESLLVCAVEQGQAFRLAGTSATVSPAGPAPADTLEGHVIVLCGERWLDLWPLCCYGPSQGGSFEQQPRSSVAGSQLYYRRERDELLYAALGLDPPISRSAGTVEAFERLFGATESEDKGTSPERALELELRRDAQGLVGRGAEVASVMQAVRETSQGVLWVWGRGGIGKSKLMARVATDLGSDPRRRLCIAWRFKASDPLRSDRGAFLRYAIARLEHWIAEHGATRAASLGSQRPVAQESLASARGKATRTNEPSRQPDRINEGLDEAQSPEEQLRTLLLQVGKLPAEVPHALSPQQRPWHRKVVFVLDGLDELVPLDPDFAELPGRQSCDHVLWLCSGRHEGILQQAFAAERCHHVFAEGLPPLTALGVRHMLIDGTGELKYGLQRLDREVASAGGEVLVVNPLVDAIVAKAEGLPLYVHHLVEDLVSGEMRLDQLASQLPAGMAAYYNLLLRRHSLGTLQAIVTPLVVTLAWAMEPLDENTLCSLLVRRTVLTSGIEGRTWLRRALRALQSLVRKVPKEGRDTGWVLYHQSLRDFVRDDPRGQLAMQSRLAREGFSLLAQAWLVGNGRQSLESPLAHYALRHLVQHLIEHDDTDTLVELLTDVWFASDKIANGLRAELARDYDAALTCIADARERELRERQQRLDAHCAAMLEYARRWTHAREAWWDDPERHPLPAPEAIPLPAPPSLAPCEDEEEEDYSYDDEGELVFKEPSPADHLRAMGRFVTAQSVVLDENRHLPSFFAQHVYNAGSAGLGTSFVTTPSHLAWAPGVLLRVEAMKSPAPEHILVDLLEAQEYRERWGDVTPDFNTLVTIGGGHGLQRYETRFMQLLDSASQHCFSDDPITVTHDGTAAFFSHHATEIYHTELREPQDLEGPPPPRTPDLEEAQDPHLLGFWFGYHELEQANQAITPDGRLALSCITGPIKGWRLDTRSSFVRFKGDDHPQPVRALRVSPDGRWAMAASSRFDTEARQHRGSLFVLDLLQARVVGLVELDGGAPQALDLLPDASAAVVACTGGRLALYQLHPLRLLRELSSGGAYAHALCVTPDGRRCLLGSWGRLAVWDLDAARCIKEVSIPSSGAPWTLRYSADGQRALVGDEHGRVMIVDLGAVHSTASHTSEATVAPSELQAFAAGRRRLVRATADGALQWYRVDDDSYLQPLDTVTPPPSRKSRWTQRLLNPLRSAAAAPRITALAFAPDEEVVAAGHSDGSVSLYMGGGQHPHAVLTVARKPVAALAWDPAGRHLLVSVEHGGSSPSWQTHLWDLGRFRRIAKGPGLVVRVAESSGHVALHGTTPERAGWLTHSAPHLPVLIVDVPTPELVAFCPSGTAAVVAPSEARTNVESFTVYSLPDGEASAIHTHERAEFFLPFVVSFRADGEAIIEHGERGTHVWSLGQERIVACDPASLPRPVAGCWTVGARLFTPRTAYQLNASPYRSAYAVVTATRLWKLGLDGTGGSWDDWLTTRCGHCQRRLDAPEQVHWVLDSRTKPVEEGIMPDDEDLEVPCPHCEGTLRFRTLVLDGRATSRHAPSQPYLHPDPPR